MFFSTFFFLRQIAVYHAHVVINIESPLANGDMAMTHFLSGMPLRVPGAKAMIGKEMGLWQADDYYQAERYSNRRAANCRSVNNAHAHVVVALDGSLFTGIESAWQQENRLIGGTLAALAALAMATDRILVLPTAVGRWRFLHAWEYIDVRYLEAMGVGWRESSFLSNQ